MAKYKVTLMCADDIENIKGDEVVEANNIQINHCFVVFYNGNSIFEDVVASFPDRLVAGVRKIS